MLHGGCPLLRDELGHVVRDGWPVVSVVVGRNLRGGTARRSRWMRRFINNIYHNLF